MNYIILNKKRALVNSFFIVICLLSFDGILYFNFNIIENVVYFYLILVLNLIVVLILFFYIKRQSIKKISLKDSVLYVYYKSKVISIPLSNIEKISTNPSLSSDFDLKIRKTYTIYLKKNKLFGNKILITYMLNEKLENSIEKEPIWISILRNECEFYNSK